MLQWLKDKTNIKNNPMLKAEVELRGMRLETKYYSKTIHGLQRDVVYDVLKTKLCPQFIGLFTSVTKKILAYTLYNPRKLRTYPVLYPGLF